VLLVAVAALWHDNIELNKKFSYLYASSVSQKKFNGMITDYIKRQLDDEKDLEGREKLLNDLQKELSKL
jgi:hypothetical protein